MTMVIRGKNNGVEYIYENSKDRVLAVEKINDIATKKNQHPQ